MPRLDAFAKPRCAQTLCVVCALLAGSAAVPAGSQTPASPAAPAASMPLPASLPPVTQTRGGLPHVFAKLKAGQPVTVVYYGGSITAGTGASQPNQTSYRALVGQWLASAFPKSVVTNVNASIGGTGSDLGAFRASRDLLPRKPDLVFVEFAVNDGPNALSARGMEGIVRQLRRANPDICFIYTANMGWMKGYQTGRVMKTALQDETIAAHYNIPSVNVGEAVAEKVMAGGPALETFFHGDPHPSDLGHQAYADAIIAFLQDQEQKPAAVPQTAALPAPMRPDALENARMAGVGSIAPIGAGWSIVAKDPSGKFPNLLVADTAGAQQTLTFDGSILGLYWVSGPDAGEFDYQIDGGPTKTEITSTKYSTKNYMAFYRVLEADLPNAHHTMTITVRPDHDANSTGTTVRIGALLVNPPLP